MRRARGFTLVELLVALFALALLAALSWRGLDGMMRARQATEARADEVLALQTGLSQWSADLEAMTAYPPLAAIDWNGRVLRLTRRSSVAPEDGVRVVGWTRRDSQWLRWESRPVFTRGALDAAWQEADLWSQTPSTAMLRQQVAIVPLQDWQIFFYRGNAWTNPMSTSAGAQLATPAATPASGAASGTAATTTSGPLPDGVRLILLLPPGRGIAGRLERDWVRPTLTP